MDLGKPHMHFGRSFVVHSGTCLCNRSRLTCSAFEVDDFGIADLDYLDLIIDNMADAQRQR